MTSPDSESGKAGGSKYNWHQGTYSRFYLKPGHPRYWGRVTKIKIDKFDRGYSFRYDGELLQRTDGGDSVLVSGCTRDTLEEAQREVELWWEQHALPTPEPPAPKPEPPPKPFLFPFAGAYALIATQGEKICHCIGPIFSHNQAQEELFRLAEEQPGFQWHIHPLKASLP